MDIKSKIGICIITVSAALATGASAETLSSEFTLGLDSSVKSLNLGASSDYSKSITSSEKKALEWLKIESTLLSDPNDGHKAWWGG